MIISVISFILVFIFVVFAHELGHFIWAKRAGIRVLELGMGFGPTLYKITKDNTVYSINLIPILAFVRLAGIDEESEDEKNCPDNEKYFSKSPWSKFKSISAGPIMNLMLGFVILSTLAIFVGLPEISPVIDSITKGSPAQKAGLIAGDEIVEYQGKNIIDMDELISEIHKSSGKKVVFTISRNGIFNKFEVIPQYDKKYKVGLIGFSFKTLYRKYAPLMAVWAGAQKTASITLSLIYLFGQLLVGKISIFDLAGPIGIVQIGGQVASKGFVSLLFFTAFISINLGVFNLLPIPALDGGRLVFVIIEAIRRKPLNIDLENKIHQWGLIALLLLLFVVSINDIVRIISAKFIK